MFMKKKNKKKFFILILLAVLLVFCFYEYKSKKQKAGEATNENAGENSQKNNSISADTENNPEPENQIKDPRLDEVISYIAENIGKISPVAPVLGGKWHANRFWAVNNPDGGEKIKIYAECEEGHIMRKFLIAADFSKDTVFYKVEAVFEPGEADWNLVQGEDLAFGKPLILFEKNQEKNKWERK